MINGGDILIVAPSGPPGYDSINPFALHCCTIFFANVGLLLF